LPLFVIVMVVLVGVLGLAVDVGRYYIARAELSRALDSAALAGVIELPSTANAQTKATTYFNAHISGGSITFPASASGQFRVRGTRNVDFVFMGLLGVGTKSVSASAAAGMGSTPSDTVIEIDATGSMGTNPCNATDSNPGCPIWESKQAALQFVDVLMGSGNSVTKVGYTPYRGCHNPPRTHATCVTNAMRVDLTTNRSSVETAINNTTAVGGSGTNTCLGLYKAQEMFNGPNHQTAANTIKSLVLLADGDNTYNATAYSASQGSPPVACRPTSNYTTSDGDVTTACLPSQSRERSLDTKTKTLADTRRAQGIEIYVVAFGVCGNGSASTPTSGYCTGVGNSDHDNAADERLLKCIASSTPGTNDHYYRVENAEDLPAVFQQIAGTISFRLTE
jgi:Flp pilus assembly protein TadG